MMELWNHEQMNRLLSMQKNWLTSNWSRDRKRLNRSHTSKTLNGSLEHAYSSMSDLIKGKLSELNQESSAAAAARMRVIEEKISNAFCEIHSTMEELDYLGLNQGD